MEHLPVLAAAASNRFAHQSRAKSLQGDGWDDQCPILRRSIDAVKLGYPQAHSVLTLIGSRHTQCSRLSPTLGLTALSRVHSATEREPLLPAVHCRGSRLALVVRYPKASDAQQPRCTARHT